MSSIKLNRYIDVDELPAMLRQLADALEKKPSEQRQLFFQKIGEFSDCKLSAKEEYGKLHLKVRIKCKTEECLLPSSDTAHPLPEYVVLKRRMQGSFKMISGMVAQGSLPTKEAVEEFTHAATFMVLHPGYGDGMYAEFSKAVDMLSKAHAVSDLVAVQAACGELKRMKSRCHRSAKLS